MTRLTFSNLDERFAKKYKLLESEQCIVSALQQELEVQFVSNSIARDVVLCTQTETFKVTKIESSNSTLLASGSLTEDEAVIKSIVGFHWEAQHTNPRLNFKLSLPAYSQLSSDLAPNLIQLQASTQASAAEIETGLQSSTVLIRDTGGIFHLHERSLYRCLDQVLMVISLQGWSLSAIPLQACAENAAKHGTDSVVAKSCLEHFSLSLSSDGQISLDVHRVARALTKALFAAKSIYSSRAELMNDLSDCLPSRVEPSLSWLDGMIDVSKEGTVSLVRGET